MIVFSTGEKLNPMGVEETIGTHPDVCGVLLVGQGRRRSSLLIEATNAFTSPEDRERLLAEIWPTVERANRLCFAQGRVSRDLVLFTSADKPMLRAGKGTIRRRATVSLYKAEFDTLYDYELELRKSRESEISC